MVNIVLGIMGTFFIAALTLETIGTLKKIDLMANIAKIFLASPVLTSYILIIKNYLPDSFFLLIYGTISISLVFICNILFIFKKNHFKIAASLIFFLNIISSFFVTSPSLKIFKYNPLLTGLIILVCLALLIFPYFFSIKQKTLLSSILYFLNGLAAILFTYSAALTLIGIQKLYSILFLLSALFLAACIFFTEKKETDNCPPLYNFLSITLCSLYILTFSSACITMQAL